MNYNYNELFSLFNLQQKEIQDVLTEAQKAIEALEINRHLLERHCQITLRLQEITARLDLIGSRLEESRGNLRLLKLEMQTAKPLHLRPPVELEASGQPGAKTAPAAGSPPVAAAQPGNKPANFPSLRGAQPADLINQGQLLQFEVIELGNQQLNLSAQKTHFEAELVALEQQLTARSIGPTHN